MKIKITLTIDTDNAAFDENPNAQINEIIKDAANRLTLPGYGAIYHDAQVKLRDINGNTAAILKIKVK